MKKLTVNFVMYVEDELLSEDYHCDTVIAIQESMDELAERLDGELTTLEIK